MYAVRARESTKSDLYQSFEAWVNLDRADEFPRATCSVGWDQVQNVPRIGI